MKGNTMTTFKFSKNKQLVANVTIKNIEPISTTFAKMGDDKAKLFPLIRQNQLNDCLSLGQTHIVHEGEEVATCFITGGSMRARIRHACADVVVKTRKAQGNPVRMKDVYALKVGQIADAKSNKAKKEKNNKKEVKNDAFARDEFRCANPLLSHFGLFEVSSTICISHGLPAAPIQPSMIGGVRFDINPTYILENLSEEDQANYLARKNRNANKSLLEVELKKLETALKKEKKNSNVSETIHRLEQEIAEKKDALAAIGDGEDMKNSTQMPLSRHIVPAGNTFYSKMVLMDIEDSASSSMLLTGLEAISRFPKIGAYKSLGGEIEMKLELRTIGDDGESESLGFLTVGGYQSLQTDLTELGQSWFDQSKNDKSWHDKINLSIPL
jgi:hypothetical protein